MLLDELGDVGLLEAQVAGALRVNDDVWAVFAQAEAVHGVDPDVAQKPRTTELPFESLADALGAAFLAVPARADERI